MRILSEEEKCALQADLHTLLAKYGCTYGYVVTCTSDGVMTLVGSNPISYELNELAQQTLHTVLNLGVPRGPRINDN